MFTSNRDALIKIFFDRVFPFAPVFNRVDFIRDYQSGDCSLFLLRVILTLASSYAPPDVLSACGFKSPSAAQESFFSKAKLLHDFIADDDDYSENESDEADDDNFIADEEDAPPKVRRKANPRGSTRKPAAKKEKGAPRKVGATSKAQTTKEAATLEETSKPKFTYALYPFHLFIIHSRSLME